MTPEEAADLIKWKGRAEKAEAARDELRCELGAIREGTKLAEAALAESQTVRGVLDKALDEERRIRKMAEAARIEAEEGEQVALRGRDALALQIVHILRAETNNDESIAILDQHAPGWRSPK